MSQVQKKIKSLSPSVSAFQFLVQPQKTNTVELTRSATPDDYFSSSSTSTSSSDAQDEQEDESTFIYRQKLYVITPETRQKLLAMGQLPLESEWTFWYDKFVPNLSATDYEANLKIIATISSVQKFWSIYNNIDGPERLGFRSNYHFMKKGIKPIWEDPHNEYGGSYHFKIPKQYTKTTWRDILVLLIGGQLEDSIKNTIYGVSISSRQHVDNYQIWTAQNNTTLSDEVVKSALNELLQPTEIQSIYFKIHKTHADFRPSTPTFSKTLK
ncbi:translation initiation factor eIF 4e-like domain-containing protein [Gilbertella persicaria]|uniref:translation initiation factor eIF 4e-like domain-containing protein n=1 Tax=Gilbertella persicaria TaxID=101096 RepID=UPI00221F7B7D|nr:translation initiation factor eIF 4e-like domain-containing protein [Gilbertella persicaria]KAI8098010.1 translation initiation factor eIF 4e-like domain-containing protein [Gilbertella persicaria]